MNRRKFITLLGGAAAWPLVARAQQTAMPVIGFLNGRSPSDAARVIEAFRQGVTSIGLVEGQAFMIDFRWAHGDLGRLPGLAAELVARTADVIATAGGTAAALAARDATATIPIVFVVGADPVQAGLVGSLNRPSGNLTGVTLTGSALAAKRIELLHELVPSASRVAVMVNPTSPATAQPQAADAETAARALGLQISVLPASRWSDFELAFAALAREHVGGLFVTNDAFFLSERNRLVALTAQHRIPAIFESREFSDAGGLSSYGTNTAEMYRQAGIYAARILKGAKPADLPVMQPTKFEWIINLRTAKALGVEIPPTLLALADEVIE